jgi:hypothetical protein
MVDTVIKATEAEGHGAFLLLFRKRVATPDNLEMLLRMVDTDVQTGKIRCIAFVILGNVFLGVDSCWSLKMKDGSYFATVYLVACCKALENETNKDCENESPYGTILCMCPQRGSATQSGDCNDPRYSCHGYRACSCIQLGPDFVESASASNQISSRTIQMVHWPTRSLYGRFEREC